MRGLGGGSVLSRRVLNHGTLPLPNWYWVDNVRSHHDSYRTIVWDEGEYMRATILS
jgi:hypothetical protein